MNKIRAIVVDDEFYNRDLISQMIISQHREYEIIGTAEDVESAYELIIEKNPEVVFLDIKMPDGSGFDLLSKFTTVKFEVVFVTGFDNYAVQAFEFNAIDYILKPVDSKKIKNTLDKVEAQLRVKKNTENRLEDVIKTFDSKEFIIAKIPIHIKDQVILLDLKDIISVEADCGYTVFRDSKNDKYISSKQMSTYEFIFEKYPNYIRINKSTYVNLTYLKSYSKGLICKIILDNKIEYEISRRKKTEILQILDRNSNINS